MLKYATLCTIFIIYITIYNANLKFVFCDVLIQSFSCIKMVHRGQSSPDMSFGTFPLFYMSYN